MQTAFYSLMSGLEEKSAEWFCPQKLEPYSFFGYVHWVTSVSIKVALFELTNQAPNLLIESITIIY